MKYVLVFVLFLMPLASMSQDTNSQSSANLRDLVGRKTALISDFNDFMEMVKALPPQGSETNLAINLDEYVQPGIGYLDATIAFLTVYEKMQCEPDRMVAKGILKDQLRKYSYFLNTNADSVTGLVALTALPRTAQEGRHLRDELHAAKDKLDAIAVSLN